MTYQAVWQEIRALLGAEQTFSLQIETWHHSRPIGETPHITLEWKLWIDTERQRLAAPSGAALLALLRADRAPPEARLVEVDSVPLPPQPVHARFAELPFPLPRDPDMTEGEAAVELGWAVGR